MQTFGEPKRRRAADTLPVAPVSGSPAQPVENWQILDEDWRNLFIPLPIIEPEASSGNLESSSRKRRRETSPLQNNGTDIATSAWLNATWPGLGPSALGLPERTWALEIPNPFSTILQHPRMRRLVIPAQIPEDGCINGLIKVRLNISKKPEPLPGAKLQRFPWFKPNTYLVARDVITPADYISYLPPDFGRGLKLDGRDEQLFNFFRVAICNAVTLIPAENCYLREVIPIAAKNDCVKHAVLALASTYLLDYATDEELKERASAHWQEAVALLTKELNYPENCMPGKEDATLAAMALFAHNEVVNWELEQPREENPSWYHASYLGEQILVKSDPLYRYCFPKNVQCNRARIQLGNKIALYNIMSATAWPLNPSEERCSFNWLLEGDDIELRKIVGCTGCSPKLMHTYAQITHLSARLFKDSRRVGAKRIAKLIERTLDNFWQWSDLSFGYSTSQELIDSCELDENGKIDSSIKTTELIGESYAAAAQIYLYCRLMRKPRKHPKVQEVLRRLLWCIDRMPTSGALFTAQSAQLRVFIGAVVAIEPEHRLLIKNWFEELVDGTRGNVPPVWRAVKFQWEWLDAKFEGIEGEGVEYSNETVIDADAEAWWESLVEELFAREGKLNLA